MNRTTFDGKDTISRVGPNGKVISCYRLADVQGIHTRKHRGKSLNVLAFSDWRVQNIDQLLKHIAASPQPDLIIYAGDDVDRFRAGGRNYFEELARLSKFGLCAVAGNDENPEARQLIAGANVYRVHSCPLTIGDFAVVGLEGAPLLSPGGARNMGYLLYPQSFRKRLMLQWTKRLTGKKLIIVSHAPPYGTLDFAVRYSHDHIGCPELRGFLETRSDAILCICGHVHRFGGQVAIVGKSVVVNAASHDHVGDPGRVARIQIRNGRVRINDIQWHGLGGAQRLLFSSQPQE
jgi:Icc-related predicted phosphoesterase